MTSPIEHVAVVGGGTAGWLTACILASEFQDSAGHPSVKVTLIESPDIPTLGVGEGTWPSMRTTLQAIGLSETEFLTTCAASFKQGTLFEDWLESGHRYIHPFTPPLKDGATDLASAWQGPKSEFSFAWSACPSAALAFGDKAPKQITTPEYAFAANYGYHLDAGAFAKLLMEHGVKRLGVQHHLLNIKETKSTFAGSIETLIAESGDTIKADLYIDCSGSNALLLSRILEVPLVNKSNILFNNAALAVQVPHLAQDSSIASSTRSTAMDHGWIWDIALKHRRGIGYVHSSDFVDERDAELTLRRYIAKEFNAEIANEIAPRKLAFEPGYRKCFWKQNVIAIGMSSGFIEPLEASALVMVETSAWLLAKNLPTCLEDMKSSADRFNQGLSRHWERIIHFLKLHYVLSKRPGAYWDAHRDPLSWPDSLVEDLQGWANRPIDYADADRLSDLFPAASYQYVFHGMGRPVGHDHRARKSLLKTTAAAPRMTAELSKKQKALFDAMPTNRGLLEKIHTFGLPTI